MNIKTIASNQHPQTPREAVLLYQHYQNSLEQIRAIAKELPEGDYHNYDHREDVATVARDLALSEQLDTRTVFNLQIAGYLHDSFLGKGHEEQSAQFAHTLLTNMGFLDRDIFDVMRYIRATKLDYQPHDIGEKIIRDADLSSLGTPSFRKANENVRREIGIDPFTFMNQTYKLMENHQYYTPTAQQRFGEKKLENMKNLEHMIVRYQYEN